LCVDLWLIWLFVVESFAFLFFRLLDLMDSENVRKNVPLFQNNQKTKPKTKKIKKITKNNQKTTTIHIQNKHKLITTLTLNNSHTLTLTMNKE